MNPEGEAAREVTLGLILRVGSFAEAERIKGLVQDAGATLVFSRRASGKIWLVGDECGPPGSAGYLRGQRRQRGTR